MDFESLVGRINQVQDVLQENDHECLWQGSLPAWEYCKPIDGIPGRMKASVEFYLNDLYDNLKMLAEEQHDEKDVYFYHSDHLGSASWITDADGKPIQHLQYLPFGEPFVNQHLTDYQERYLFTGKERDEETGYGYFGARYMDHEMLTSFLSVDRYADKYPFISPYAYCAWNPVKLIDPSGDTICYKYNNKVYYYTKMSEGNYSWVNNDGNKHMGGEDVNFDNLTDALRKLQEKPAGNKLVGDLIADDQTVEIACKQANGSDQINGKWVKWNPYKTTGNFLNEDGSHERPSFIGLGHELAHIYDVWHGTNDQTEWFTTPFGDVVPKCEITVGAVENLLRAEHGIPRRKFYFYHVDEKKGSIYYNGLLINNN